MCKYKKGRLKVFSYLPIFAYVLVRNDWSKVTYSQVHGSSVLNENLFKS